ncbi:zinc ribbon domain-containing protein [Herpetosiphon geysericola]|uniref:Uncharacterized protein n=1 Tax=Herpetosiphon geysericola TaxID=70996 RepID=A0A0P6XRY4_9CHLR|nr:zinc ribbon domain-containing protein [Herpetosiphon geysericola]KPL85472.1 hypothetical protein SE18_17760 [Herpetosiphon geysericola]
MQCPACAMTLATASASCPYCGKQLNQPKRRANLLAFGASIFMDALLMVASLGLALAEHDRDAQSFRVLSNIRQPNPEWPALWTSLSYAYSIVVLLAFLAAIACLISQNALWARAAMFCGMAGSVILATFGFGAFINASAYSPLLGFWLGLFGSFTLTTTSLLFQITAKK